MGENPLAFGLGLSREAPPLCVVIFGASGDLTARKLIPALFSLYLKGHAPRLSIVGFARREWDDAAFRKTVRGMLDGEEFGMTSAELKEAFIGNVFYNRSDFNSLEGFAALRRRLADQPNRLLYLAVPPDNYEPILERIEESGIAEQTRGFSRIVVEKPLGRDLESARRLNRRLSAAFSEEQIYRIDHYLGKETVQNIMLLRFGNEIFEPIWNNRFVDQVQITMAETIGVESRGRYYESAGALRDMVQNHMLQLLCLVAMEPPVDQSPDSIRNEKLKVLKSIQPIRGERVAADTVRAQYIRGIVGGADAPGYREEPGVDPASDVETYAALRLRLDTWRWAGVPFLLRTGKRLSYRTTEISVHFKRPPLSLFGGGGSGGAGGSVPAQANVLVFRIQPQEGITMSFNAKVPGYASRSRAVNMDFSYGSAFGGEIPEAYERLLLDAMVGDSTLFMREDEVDTAWGFITEILNGWRERGLPGLSFYRAGSAGPAEASRLQEDGIAWRRL